VLKFYFVKHYFSPLNIFVGKVKDPEPDPDPYLRLIDTDPDPGGPKPYGSGSPTLTDSKRFKMIKD
jgi:hypothetical protein